MKAPVDSFVVRIYRCQRGKKQQLVGVVQTPRSGGSLAFTSVAQLWEILSTRPSGARAKPRATPASAGGDG